MSEEPLGEENDERWDEFRWEKLLKENDDLTDKFARIVEQYGDDPNLEAILAHEMGWDEKESEGEEPDFFSDDDDTYDDGGEEWKAAAGIQSEEFPGVDEFAPGRSDSDFRTDALYQKAFEFAINSRKWFRQLPETIQNDPDAVEIISHAAIPAAKIAGAFEMKLS